MKLESIYTEVLKVENAIKNNYTAAAVTLLETLRAELENELKHEANARSGKKAIERAALAILKAAGNARPVLMKANRNADGLTVSDGYRAIIFNIESAPALPENESGANYPNFKDIFTTAAGNARPLTLPTAETLRAFIKVKKAEEAAKPKNERAAGIIYELENGQNVSAEFLLTMLEALPNCNARAHSRGGQYPLYFESANGRGVLCVMQKRTGADV